MSAAERLRVDSAGRLLSGSARLMTLNDRAGGAVGAPLALPSLAMLARLARALDMPLSRAVIVADGDTDIELHVAVTTMRDASDLVATGWYVRAARASWLNGLSDSVAPVATPPWRWRSDAALTLTEVVFAPDDAGTMRSEALLGKPLTRLVRLIEDADGDLPLLAALAGGTGFLDQRAVRRDLPDTEIRLTAQPLHDSTGAFVGFAGTAGPLVVAAAPVADDPRFAERLGRALRAPLDRIVTRADSIAAQSEGPLRRDYADYAGDIASAGRHLLALVDDLADLEAVERPDFVIIGELIDLADLARRAGGLLQVRAADRGVRIDRPDSDETLTARGDFGRVLQILVNLIGNAVRYSPPGSMVWLRTEGDAETAVVIVADQGKGIAPDDQLRIFDKFERVDPSEPGGSGLGLYISRRLARAMGGDITVDSAPGQGARFVLTLPR